MRLTTSLLGFAILFLVSCTRTPHLATFSGKTMGTTYNVKFFAERSDEDPSSIAKLIEEELAAVNREMSTYQKDSEISYFNNLLPMGDWLSISEGFYLVLDHALAVASETQGLFDPTVGPLVNLWGFGPEGERKIPSKEDISRARGRVGYQKIEIDSVGRRIKKTIPGVYIDLSASAKGHGVDRVAKVLEREGVKSYMVEVGGEVKTKGQGPSGDWRIAIDAPNFNEGGKPYQKILHVKDAAIATSGDYRNFFEEGGKRYSHTINTETGEPVASGFASVTVINPVSCMEADSWATALTALGPIKAIELAEARGIAAYFIYREGERTIENSTTAFNQFFGAINGE
jgi:thiamine biosynthesis lipoprotein